MKESCCYICELVFCHYKGYKDEIIRINIFTVLHLRIYDAKYDGILKIRAINKPTNPLNLFNPLSFSVKKLKHVQNTAK